MTTAVTEDRHVVARRVFDALCARFPDKHVALNSTALCSRRPAIERSQASGDADHFVWQKAAQ